MTKGNQLGWIGAVVAGCVIALAGASGCKEEGAGANSGGANAAGVRETQLALNWKPEPQFGGFYAAELSGAYAAKQLKVEILPGGSGTPTVQMVAAGRVPFAIVSADEVLISRDRGSDVVALLAVYQTNPQGLMTHAKRGLKEIGEIFGQPGQVAIQAGLPYANFLKNKYGFEKVTVVPNTAGLAVFARDEAMTLQCFVTSEPLQAKAMGLDVKTFLVAESGYNPYTTVLVTRGELVQKDRKLVADMTEACRAGWETYLKDPGAANELMGKLNTSMDAGTFAASALAQKPLIEVGGNGGGVKIGGMTDQRWKELAGQLKALGVIGNENVAEGCFVAE